MTAQDDEFETYAQWTREAVERLGPDVAIPAGCRGSGTPAMLSWLLDRMKVGPDDLLVDVGAGVGGPAAYAVQRTGARAVALDVSEQGCAAAGALFGIPSAVSSADGVPLSDNAARVAWALGVICTLDDPLDCLVEAVRVLRPGGHLGLFVLVKVRESDLPTPGGNAFPTEPELHRLIEDAGLQILDEAPVDDLDEPDDEWTAAEQAVEDAIRAEHEGDDAFEATKEQESRMSALLDEGSIRKVLLVCRT